MEMPWRRQTGPVRFSWGDQGRTTFAISPQLLPASRIVFNLCSSVAVQGVFVLPFFLPASPRGARAGAGFGGVASVGTTLLPSAGAGGLEGDPGGLVSGWSEARRFLGLGDVGGKVEKVVLVAVGCEGLGASTGAVGAANAAGEVVEADTFCRFWEGGDLSSPISLAKFFSSSRSKIERDSEELTPYWPRLSSDFAPRSTMYGHPDAQALVVVGINREYPFWIWSCELIQQMKRTRCTRVHWHAVAWSGTVTPREGEE
jgi:hypothetical protein